MPKPSQDAWLVAERNRLNVIPDSGEAWASGHESAVFRFGGSEYRDPQYASEWLALTGCADRNIPIGIYFDMVMFPDLIRWLNRGFENVQPLPENAFHVLFAGKQDVQEEGWPFLPCEALRSATSDYAIWIPSFYPVV